MYLMDRMIKALLLTLLLTFFLILHGETAFAQFGCTVGVTSISFGNYNVFSSTPADTVGTITVNCGRRVVQVNVTLGVSQTSGAFIPRQMRRSAGSDRLSYNIYTDPARTTIFGNGTGGTSDVRLHRPPGPPANWSQIITTYGRIPPGQDVSVGTYSDTLSVTVTP
jgi:spore coat protein U-like protein